MKLAEDRVAIRKFMQAAEDARTARFEKQGTFQAVEILEDVKADKKLWASVLEPLAREAAVSKIRKMVKRSDIQIDLPQGKLFEDLPRLIRSLDGWVPITAATVEQLRWYVNWQEKRWSGNLARSERDNQTLERLRHLLEVAERRAGKNDKMAVVEAVERTRSR